MIICPKCGKENQDHYKFCLGCGNELPRDGAGMGGGTGGQRPFQPTPPAGMNPGAARGAGGGAPPNPFAAPPGAFSAQSTNAPQVPHAPAAPPNPFAAPGAPPFAPPPGFSASGSSPAPTPYAPPPAPPSPFTAPSPTPFAAPPSAPSGRPSMAPVCDQCGTPNPSGKRFCLTCGNDLAQNAPAVSAPAPAPVAAPPPVDHGFVAQPPAPAPVYVPPAVPERSMAAPEVSIAPERSFAVPPAPAAAAASFAAPSSRARLVLIRPDGTEGGSFQLNEGTMNIGRNTGSLFASDTFLSPRHATFVVDGTSVTVKDENSLNGVFLRLDRQAPTELNDTDVFRIGQEILRYEAYHPVRPTDDGTEQQGSQIEGLAGRVLLMIGRDTSGSAFPVPVTGLFLGRERGDILFPEDGYVSGLHCQLSFEGGRLVLTDLNSSNGTYIRLRAERTLRNNDLLLMGMQLFRLTLT